MSKPDDIPQDVWEESSHVWNTIADGTSEGATIAIARAIMAAKAEERERCAKVSEDFNYSHWGPVVATYIRASK